MSATELNPKRRENKLTPSDRSTRAKRRDRARANVLPFARVRSRIRYPEPARSGPGQGPLFREIVETEVTSDEAFEAPDGSWGTSIVKPPGKGWRVADYSHDKETHWLRRLPLATAFPSREDWEA